MNEIKKYVLKIASHCWGERKRVKTIADDLTIPNHITLNFQFACVAHTQTQSHTHVRHYTLLYSILYQKIGHLSNVCLVRLFENSHLNYYPLLLQYNDECQTIELCSLFDLNNLLGHFLFQCLFFICHE